MSHTSQRPQRALVDHQRRSEIASAVHELRTPLATVRGLLETLLNREDDLDPQVRHDLTTIALRNAVLLGQRVNALLDHERFASGAVQIAPVAVRLHDEIARIVEDCSGLLRDHVVDLEVDELTLAEVDTDALAHVLGNLLGNAAKHSPAGSHITVRASSTADEVRIEVIDQGEGIDASDLPQVFEPFYRGGRRRSGTGLGLSVVQRYVDLWGGQIEITSTVDQGTIVTFTVRSACTAVHQDGDAAAAP